MWSGIKNEKFDETLCNNNLCKRISNQWIIKIIKQVLSISIKKNMMQSTKILKY